jgi:hypothetical protein
MSAKIRSLFGALAFGVAALAAGAALAGGGSNCGCGSPPPTPPPAPCCQPPHPPNGDPNPIPGINININVQAAVVVGAQAQAQASAQASGSATTIFYGGGGWNGGGMGPGATTVIQNLVLGGGGEAERSAYEATRTRIKKVIIQASCIDDKDVPHPASQVTPDRDIEESYDGEIYRCIAGTRMQYVWAEFNGQIAFDHGQTVTCGKAQALYHSPGGQVECRAQRPARDCNERSLLRRFGAGMKILTMVTVERYTAYHEQSIQTQSAGSLNLDGGVGGMVY